jgi:hypothetical protein
MVAGSSSSEEAKIAGITPRRVDLDGKVGALAAVDLHADLALGVLDVDLAQRALDEDHEGDHRDGHEHDADDDGGAQRAGAPLGEELGERGGQLGDDAHEDDERDAVADAARGDLLADPHQEHGAADQRDDAADAEEPTGVVAHALGLEPHGEAVGLGGGEEDGAVARVLVDLLAAGLAFLLQRHQAGDHGGHQLDDDGGGDVGHDAEGEDRHAAHGAAGEHVEHPADAGIGLLEELREPGGVDAGDRDEGADAVDDQQADGEKDAVLQLLGLAEGAPAEDWTPSVPLPTPSRPLLKRRRRTPSSGDPAARKLPRLSRGPGGHKPHSAEAGASAGDDSVIAPPAFSTAPPRPPRRR